jgi:hypothetical protein
MWLPLCFVAALLLAVPGGGQGERSDVYVVYMGAVPPRTSPSFLQETHLRLVGSILKRCATSRVYINFMKSTCTVTLQKTYSS